MKEYLPKLADDLITRYEPLENGFYWVKPIYEEGWTVAEYRRGFWIVPGYSSIMKSVYQINKKRILQPNNL